MNNKGFTLIELLGVIVVLTLILLVAIPTITTTYQKNKNRKIEEQKEIIIGAAEIYMSTYMANTVIPIKFFNKQCYIEVDLLQYKGLLTIDEIGNSYEEYVVEYDGSKMIVKKISESSLDSCRRYGNL